MTAGSYIGQNFKASEIKLIQLIAPHINLCL